MPQISQCIHFFPATSPPCSFYFLPLASHLPHCFSDSYRESGDEVGLCVLLFVTKMRFREMDGEIPAEKCSVKESSGGKKKDGL